MSKLGLVFSGGGGKGAYEIGVWRALKEFGIDQEVQAVSGTSVGGLNGALFVQGDFEAGEHLWQSISPDKILKIDITKITQLAAKFASRLSVPINILLEMATTLKGRGWFTQEGLQELVRESGVCSTVNKSELPFHVCALNGNTGKLELPLLNGRPEEEIEKWLLASAAIPIVFGSVEINGERYHDGGVLPMLSNNTPYDPLINKHGCTHVISIYLDNAPLMRKAQSLYPAVKFWNIVPSTPFQGCVLAPLNFTPENARELMERGYCDAKRLLIQFRDFQKVEERSLDRAKEIEDRGVQFNRQKQINQNLRADPCSDMENSLSLLDHLEAEIDRRELDLIDGNVESFLERYTDNSNMMQEAMFEGIARLASTEGRINHAMNRGLLSRVWEGVTGKSGKLTAEIQWDMNRAIYFNQTLITKLSERNALTLEAVSSLGTRLNYIMGHANYLTAASNFHQKAIGMLAKHMSQLQMNINRRLKLLENQVETNKHDISFLKWSHGLPQRLAGVSSSQALIYTSQEFYKQKQGEWQLDDLFTLEVDFDKACQGKSCSLQDLASSLPKTQSQIDTSFFAPVIADSAVVHPAYSAIHPASSQDIALLEKCGISCEAKIPVVQLLTEILCSMRLRDRRRNDVLSTYKTQAIELDKLCAQTGMREYQTPLKNWQQEMEDYRVLVPLIGKFSAGKSTLLNAFLGRALLGEDLDPETADASELHFGLKEHAEGIFLNGEETPIPDVAAMLPSPESNSLWYYRRYVNNPLLKHLDRLVLVDMPGFDSTRLNHEKAIANYMERGEVFIGVLSSDTPYDDDSAMEVLSEAYNNGKEIHLAVTRCGRCTDEKLQEIRQTLRDTFTGVSPVPEIALVESKTGEPGISEFSSLLFNISSRFNDFFRARFEPDLLNFKEQIRRKLESELKLSQCDDVELEQQMAMEQKAFATLNEILNREKEALKEYLTNDAVEDVIQEVLDVLMGSESMLLSAGESGALQQTIASLVRPVTQTKAKQVVEQAVADFTRRIQHVIDQPNAKLNINVAVMNTTMKEGNNGNLSAGIGGIVGAVVLGPVGAFIGAVIGKFFGNNKNEVQEENRTLIRTQVIPGVLQFIRQQLISSFGEYADDVGNAVQNFIGEQRESLEARRTELNESINSKQEMHNKRSKVLEIAIATIDNDLTPPVYSSERDMRWLN
ncbi:patatin-like phospholipase family protein [Desulfoluna sp.]|uniref:patatin-like phospholipase family protein n=1 Tax=Desulfoluna sp. TaxID=2045199 RepID=UPI002606A51A|nr:patatin-like phospholipase family protein [Desulfoluna sp.]